MTCTATDHLDAIAEVLRRNESSTALVFEDVRILRSMILAATDSLNDGYECADSLRDEFRKQRKDFFARAVTNSMERIDAARKSLK